MKKNMGSTDRMIRVIFAIVVSILFFTHTITGTAGLVLLILGGIINFCPLYLPFGINTCKTDKKV
jgi:hypothetical protein